MSGVTRRNKVKIIFDFELHHRLGMTSISSDQLTELGLDLRLPEDLQITQDHDFIHLKVECAQAAVSIETSFHSSLLLSLP